MDMTTISAAYSGLKTAKDIFSGLTHLKIETDTLDTINDAVKKVAVAQDTLFTIREELFRLQSENEDLKKIISASDSWESKLSNYELTKTDGGAVVYKSKGEPEHYICPSCVSKKSIEILQDNRTSSGKYRCVGCKSEFPINPQKPVRVHKVIKSRF